MNKKYKIIGLVIIIIIGLLGVIGYCYLSFHNKKTNVDNSNNVKIKEIYQEKLRDGFTEKNLSGGIFYEDVTNKYLDKIVKSINKDEEYYSVYLKFDDNLNKLSFVIKDSNNTEVETRIIEINNIKQYLIEGYSENAGTSDGIFVLTETGDVYFYNVESNDNYNDFVNSINNFQKVNTNYQYKELRIYNYNVDFLNSPYYSVVGITNNNKNMSLIENLYIYDNEVQEKEFVYAEIKNAVLRDNDNVYYVLNDYLYLVNDNNNQVVKNAKVKYLLTKNDEEKMEHILLVIFEDGSEKELRGSIAY